MLSISKLGAESTAYASYLENYFKNDGDAGVWGGSLASVMGLEGLPVEQGQLLRALQGFDPASGSALASNAGEKHKAGWDATFSAPKPVSAVWALADDSLRQKIEAAQLKAAQEAVQFLEQKAMTNRDRNGNNRVNAVLAAYYQHGTSRANDPDLHTHTPIFNMTQRPDGTWCAVEFNLKWKMAAGAVYRVSLANAMKELGFQVERDQTSFKLAGVSDDLCQHWSKRRLTIMEEVKNGGHNTAEARQAAAITTRGAKSEKQADQNFFERVKEEAAAFGVSLETILAAQNAPELTEELAPTGADGAAPLDPLSDEALLVGLVEHNSAFTETELWKVVAQQSQGLLDVAGIHKRVGEIMRSKELVTLKKIESADDPRQQPIQYYTTRAMLELERNLAVAGVAMAQDRAKAVPANLVADAVAGFQASRGFELSPEQLAATKYITAESGSLAIVQGAAGAGKTTALEAARMAWESNGQRVLGAAVAGVAAAKMQNDAGIRSTTIAKLLIMQTPEATARAEEWLKATEARHAKTLAFVQKLEASFAKRTTALLSQKQEALWLSANERLQRAEAAMKEARGDLEAAKASILKLSSNDVLVIDEAGMVGSKDMAKLVSLCQEAGAKLVLVGDAKQLQAISAGGAFDMLQKQFAAAGQKMVELLDNRRQKSEADRDTASQLREGQAAAALKNMLERDQLHVSSKADESMAGLVAAYRADPALPKDKIVMAKTRDEVFQLNQALRAANPALLGDSVTVRTHEGRLAFAENDRFLFLKNNAKLGISNGDFGTVSKIEFHSLGVVFEVKRDINPQPVRFLVGDPEDKALRKAAKAEGLQVYNQFDLGYASTVHKSQGQSVAHAYALGLGDREMTYVMGTRHKEEFNCYVTAKELENVVSEQENAAGIDDAPDKSLLERLADIEKTMEKSSAKGTTLDFVEVPELDQHDDEDQQRQQQEQQHADELALSIDF